jgi:hypothetical protein
MRSMSLGVFLIVIINSRSYGDTISLWNFNDAIQGITGGTQEFSSDRGNGFMDSNFLPSTIGNSIGTTVNSELNDPAGRALHLSGDVNNGCSLTWMIDTTGYAFIDIGFGTRRTNTGFNSNQFLYSADSGLSWTSFGSPYEPETDYDLQRFDLSVIDALNNNSGTGFRIIFDGATSYSGNNRIDNLIVSGVPITLPVTTPVPEPSTLALISLGLFGVYLTGVKGRQSEIIKPRKF